MPYWISAAPIVFMIFMTGWAMIINLISFWGKSQWRLAIIGAPALLLEIRVIVETALVLRRKINEPCD